VIFDRRCTLFKGDNFSNRHKTGSKAGRNLSTGKLLAKNFASNTLPVVGSTHPSPKNARILQWVARVVQETEIVLASNFFPELLNYPQNTEACSRELSQNRPLQNPRIKDYHFTRLTPKLENSC